MAPESSVHIQQENYHEHETYLCGVDLHGFGMQCFDGECTSRQGRNEYVAVGANYRIGRKLRRVLRSPVHNRHLLFKQLYSVHNNNNSTMSGHRQSVPFPGASIMRHDGRLR